MTAALAPHEQTFDHVMADCTHAGAAVAPVADPATAAHGPLAMAAIDVQGGGGLVEAADGTASAELDHLVGHIPEAEALQQVDVGRVPVLLVVHKRNEAGGRPGLWHIKAFHPSRLGTGACGVCRDAMPQARSPTWVCSSMSFRTRSPSTMSTDTAICTSPCSA